MQTIEKKYHDPKLDAICKETKQWWSGIKDGSIKFVPGMELTYDYVPAYIPGHVHLITGYTSAGKSQLIAQIINHTAGIVGAETVVFSLEDKRMEKMFSLASSMTDIHRRKMILGHLTRDEQDYLDETLSKISLWPLLIYDDVRDIDAMKKICDDIKPQIVILDYIQKVRKEGAKIYDRMAYAADETFFMAQDGGYTFIIASQIGSQDAKDDNDNTIAAKGAGDLVEAAHLVIQLKKGRQAHNKKQVDLHIKKNKAFGEIGTIEGQFNSHWTAIERVFTITPP